MNILLNKNTIDLSQALANGTAQFPVSAYNQRFYPVMNYAVSLNRGYTYYKNITFERAGTFKYLSIAIGFGNSYFENGTKAELTIKLQENVGGTWIDRSQVILKSDDYRNDDDKWSKQTLVLIEMPEYPIDTDANKWRFSFKNDRVAGTDSANWFLWQPFSSGAFSNTIYIIPFLKETETYDPSTDIMVNFGQMTISDSITFEGVPTTGYGFYATGYPAGRIAIINGGTKKNEPHPQTIIEPAVANMEVKRGGFIFIHASNEKKTPSLLIRNLDPNKKLTLPHHNGSSTWRGFVVSLYSASYNTYTFLKIEGLKLDGFKAVMNEAHHKNDTQIKLTGDFSHWEVNDHIMTSFAKEKPNRIYHDYDRQETIKITGVSYDAGTDITTIDLETALKHEYDYQHYIDYHGITIDPNEVPYYVLNIDKITNIKIEGDSYTKTTTNNNKMDMYSYFKGVYVEIEGATIKDFYRFAFRGPQYSAMRIGSSYVKNSAFGNCYQPITGYYQKNLLVEGNVTYKSAIGSGVAYLVANSYSNNVIVRNNLSLRTGYIAQTIGTGWIIEGNEYEGTYFINNYGKQVVVRNNIIRNANSGIVVKRSCDITGENNIWGKVLYLSTYNTNSTYYSAIYKVDDGASGKGNVINDKVYFCHAYVNAIDDKGADMFFKDSQVIKTISENPKVHIDTTVESLKQDRWLPDTVFAFQNFNNDGINEAWRHEGYELLTSDPTYGAVWLLKSYDTSTDMFFRKSRAVGITGKSLTVKVLLKLSDDFLTGEYKLPILKLKGLGMTGQVEALPHNDWQYLTLTAIPLYTGQAEIELTFYNESGDVKVASIYPFVDDPVATADLEILSRGLSYNEIFSEKLTAGQIVNAPLSNGQSLGENIINIKNDTTLCQTKIDNLPTSDEISEKVESRLLDETDGKTLLKIIAETVESHLIDELDGQKLIETIKLAIDNENIDEVALVSSIRADIERNGGLTDTIKSVLDSQNNKIEELYKLQGLELNKPMTVSKTSRKVDNIELDIKDNNDGSITVERK